MRGNIEKRGPGCYRLRIYLGPDSQTGRPRIWRKTLHCSRREAEAYLAAQVKQLEFGEWLAPDTALTVAEQLDAWLDSRRGDVRARTLSDYQQTVDLYLRPQLGAILLSDLSAERIQQHYEALRSRGLSARTMRLIHTVLKAALNNAVALRRLRENPAATIKAPRRGARATINVLTAEDARRFREAVKSSRHCALFLLALETGARPEEYLALRWSDLDWSSGEITITRTLYWPRTGGFEFVDGMKRDHSRRRIPLSAELLAALRAHRDSQIQLMRVVERWQDHDLIFPSEHGTPQHRDNVAARCFKPLIRALGLPRMRLYDLRHTCATLLLGAGVNPKVVAERLGHSSVAFTLDAYAHVLPHQQSEATAALAAVLH